MSITDELREWAHGFNGPWRRNEEMLLAIADRIDEEHERGMADAYLNGMPTDEKLAELGWVRLPKDADGEVIHIEDRVEDNERVVRIELVAHYISDEDAQRIRGHIDQLETENAKLRELVQDIYGVMWACAEQRCTHRHDGCFRVHGNHGDICVSERCWYEDRMRELGIEV